MRISSRLGPIASALMFVLTTSVAGGCGDSDGLPREGVSGAVSIEGKPLKSGVITFLPDSPDVPTQGGGMVTEGKYSIPRAQGLVPGKYRIVITSPEDKPEVIPDKGFNNDAPGMPRIPPKQAIPAQYNDKSLLTAEVRAGGANVFEFNLTNAPAAK